MSEIHSFTPSAVKADRMVGIQLSDHPGSVWLFGNTETGESRLHASWTGDVQALIDVLENYKGGNWWEIWEAAPNQIREG